VFPWSGRQKVLRKLLVSSKNARFYLSAELELIWAELAWTCTKNWCKKLAQKNLCKFLVQVSWLCVTTISEINAVQFSSFMSLCTRLYRETTTTTTTAAAAAAATTTTSSTTLMCCRIGARRAAERAGRCSQEAWRWTWNNRCSDAVWQSKTGRSILFSLLIWDLSSTSGASSCMHWATRWRHSALSVASSSASSQLVSMSFRSRLMMSIQFFFGHPSFL